MKSLRKQISADKQAQAPVPTLEPSAAKEKQRKGLHFVGGYFTPKFTRALKVILAQEGSTMQAFVREALEDAGRRRGVVLED